MFKRTNIMIKFRTKNLTNKKNENETKKQQYIKKKQIEYFMYSLRE